MVRIVISSNEMKQTVDAEVIHSYDDLIQAITDAQKDHLPMSIETEDRVIFVAANIIATAVIEVMKEVETNPWTEGEDVE